MRLTVCGVKPHPAGVSVARLVSVAPFGFVKLPQTKPMYDTSFDTATEYTKYGTYYRFWISI